MVGVIAEMVGVTVEVVGVIVEKVVVTVEEVADQDLVDNRSQAFPNTTPWKRKARRLSTFRVTVKRFRFYVRRTSKNKVLKPRWMT